MSALVTALTWCAVLSAPEQLVFAIRCCKVLLMQHNHLMVTHSALWHGTSLEGASNCHRQRG